MKKIKLDGDTADKITLLTLCAYRKYLKKELKQWNKNPKTEDNPGGVWMHPDDVGSNARTIEALTEIISHYGG